MGKLKDETGKRFGRLLVLSRGTNVIYGKTTVMWECRCDCGTLVTTAGASLRTGATKSCGCLSADTAKEVHTKHGYSPVGGKSKTYHAWESMRSRCCIPTDVRYPDYGGRGIKVCARWSEFAAFLKDMGEAPPDRSLDRIDNELGYSPENCRWATRMEQVCNRRNSIKITVAGVTKVLKHWCHEFSINYETARLRVRAGENPKKVLMALVSAQA